MIRRSVVVRQLMNFVSVRHAPSFFHLPEAEAIGKSVRHLPPNALTAYVIPDAITESEEAALLRLSSDWFDRLPFNDGHVDGLIHHYKEFYRSYTSLTEALAPEPEGLSGLQKAHALALRYLPQIPVDDRVHFLRLETDGFIRAHVDESRNSSGLIGGLCLGSARVMVLTHPKFPGERAELLLAPRCFYVLIGRARYEWEHSVDWMGDDAEHLQRIQTKVEEKSAEAGKQRIVFDGKETAYWSGTRTAIIFRGISPMALLQHRMADHSNN